MAGIGKFRQILREPNVFISYSHDSDEHSGRVRELAQRLKDEGHSVTCDHDVDDPNQGWPQWSGDQAKSASHVLVVMTETYSRRWDGTEEPGKGRGATHEAQIIYQRLYDSGRENAFCRVVVFEKADRDHIPTELKRFRNYDTEETFGDLSIWLKKPLPEAIEKSEVAAADPDPWPGRPEAFQWRMANRIEECAQFASMLAGETERSILLFKGESGRGKSLLVSELMRYLEYLPGCDCGHIDCKDSPTDEQFRLEISRELGLEPDKLCDQLETSQQVKVLIIDTYEKANEELCRWIEKKLLPAICRSSRVICVIGGQSTPKREGSRLEDESHYFELTPITDVDAWVEFHQRRENPAEVDHSFITQLTNLAGGDPRLIRPILEGKNR